MCLQVRDNEAEAKRQQLPIRKATSTDPHSGASIASPESSYNTEQDITQRRSIKRDSTEMEMGASRGLPSDAFDPDLAPLTMLSSPPGGGVESPASLAKRRRMGGS